MIRNKRAPAQDRGHLADATFIQGNVSIQRGAMPAATTTRAVQEADMGTITGHTVKIKRAKSLAKIGTCRESVADMVSAIPDDVIEALPSRLIAQLLDANWQLAQEAKALAMREAITDGGVWDARCDKFRGFEQ